MTEPTFDPAWLQGAGLSNAEALHEGDEIVVADFASGASARMRVDSVVGVPVRRVGLRASDALSARATVVCGCGTTHDVTATVDEDALKEFVLRAVTAAGNGFIRSSGPRNGT